MECLEAASRDGGSSTLSSVSAPPLLLTVKIMPIFPCGSSVLEQVGSIQQKTMGGLRGKQEPQLSFWTLPASIISAGDSGGTEEGGRPVCTVSSQEKDENFHWPL